MARPRKKIDPDLVEKLASIHCTMEEISAVCGVSVDTLERRFADLIKEGKAKGRSSLRRLQWQKAQEGHPTMLVWLGKNILGQTDKIEASENPAVTETRQAQVDALISEMRTMMQDTECPSPISSPSLRSHSPS